MQYRKPVSTVQTTTGNIGVVCDDGAVFVTKSGIGTTAQWTETTPIPGTEREAIRNSGTGSNKPGPGELAGTAILPPTIPEAHTNTPGL